jgi:tetrahydromethanopterin S-methyltransferase subunit H
MNHDMIFSGPMVGASRIMPAIAMANAFQATAVYSETGRLPKDPNHPLFKLFPDFVENIKNI